jgi:diacylglycerol kinase (ATP)
MTFPHKPVKYNPFTSFGYASRGVVDAFKSEPNLRYQIVVGFTTAGIALFTGRWILAMANLVFMGIVMSLEAMNTAIEAICDFIEPELNPKIRFIKDVSAGAVLISSLTWATVLVFQFATLFIPEVNRFFVDLRDFPELW